MSHHKRGKPKSARAGCLCNGKDNKQNGWKRKVKVKGVPRHRALHDDPDIAGDRP